MNTIYIYKRIKKSKDKTSKTMKTKKTKTKTKKSFEIKYVNLFEEEKQKKVEYLRNYCLTHKKCFGGFYKVVGN